MCSQLHVSALWEKIWLPLKLSRTSKWEQMNTSVSCTQYVLFKLLSSLYTWLYKLTFVSLYSSMRKLRNLTPKVYLCRLSRLPNKLSNGEWKRKAPDTFRNKWFHKKVKYRAVPTVDRWCMYLHDQVQQTSIHTAWTKRSKIEIVIVTTSAISQLWPENSEQRTSFRIMQSVFNLLPHLVDNFSALL